MKDVDLTNMSVEEIKETLLDNFRIVNNEYDLEKNAPSEEATKYLQAVRLLAKEDSTTIADAFVGMSLEFSDLEDEANEAIQMVNSLADIFDATKDQLGDILGDDDAQGA